MTPLVISIILHYYGRADDYRGGDFSAPAVREAIQWLLSEDLIEPKQTVAPAGSVDREYDLAERGRAYVGFLLALPLPEKRWIMPEDAA